MWNVDFVRGGKGGVYAHQDRLRTMREGVGGSGLGWGPWIYSTPGLGCPWDQWVNCSPGLGAVAPSGSGPLGTAPNISKPSDKPFDWGGLWSTVGGAFGKLTETAKEIAPSALTTWGAIEAAKAGRMPWESVPSAGRDQPMRAGSSMGVILLVGALGLGAYLLLRKKR